MRRLLLLALPAMLALSACSSSRTTSRDGDRYPDGRVIRTPSGDVIVGNDGTIYRDANRNGIPDTREDGRYDRNGRRTDGRTAVCHKGRTIVVSDNAVNAHARHGDRIGQCRNDRSDRDRDRDRNGRYDRDDDDDDDDRRKRNRGRNRGGNDDDDR